MVKKKKSLTNRLKGLLPCLGQNCSIEQVLKKNNEECKKEKEYIYTNFITMCNKYIFFLNNLLKTDTFINILFNYLKLVFLNLELTKFTENIKILFNFLLYFFENITFDDLINIIETYIKFSKYLDTDEFKDFVRPQHIIKVDPHYPINGLHLILSLINSQEIIPLIENLIKIRLSSIIDFKYMRVLVSILNDICHDSIFISIYNIYMLQYEVKLTKLILEPWFTLIFLGIKNIVVYIYEILEPKQQQELEQQEQHQLNIELKSCVVNDIIGWIDIDDRLKICHTRITQITEYISLEDMLNSEEYSYSSDYPTLNENQILEIYSIQSPEQTDSILPEKKYSFKILKFKKI